MVLVKNWQFFSFFILDKMRDENVFQHILERKKVYTIKSTSRKSQKIGIFPKGLVHGFGQKLAIFPFFYFRQNTR